MDPLAVEDEAILAVRGEVEEILWLIDESLSFHDFRMVHGKKQINLIFDVVVPHSYTQENRERLVHKIKTAMHKKDLEVPMCDHCRPEFCRRRENRVKKLQKR